MEIADITLLIIAIWAWLLALTLIILLIPTIVESYRETFSSDRK